MGTLVGFSILLVLLLLAAQISLRLYTTSTVGAVAVRAAEAVAESPLPAGAVGPAEEAARRSLGDGGSSPAVRFVWKEADAEQVVLEMSAPAPRLLPVPGWPSTVSRTVTIRTERFR